MSNITNSNTPAIPGTISVMSRQNTVHNPSLVHDVWQYNHDPDDQYIKNIIKDKVARLHKQHSHQDIQSRKQLLLYDDDNDGDDGLDGDYVKYHSQLNVIDNMGIDMDIDNTNINAVMGRGMNMETTNVHKNKMNKMQRNQYGLAGGQYANNIYLKNDNKTFTKKSGTQRSISNGSHTAGIRYKNNKKITAHSKSNKSKQSLQDQHAHPPYDRQNHDKYLQQQLQQEQFNIGKQQQLGNVRISQTNISANRNLDIYSHKYVSNLNLMLRQTKQLLQWNRMYQTQADIQEYRKNIMKLEIECRKLKIGLRSSISIFKLRKQEYGIEQQQRPKILSKQARPLLYTNRSKNKKSVSSRPNLNLMAIKSPSNQHHQNKKSKILFEKQKILQQKIDNQKKKYQELGTRQSLITNYYHVWKNKLLSDIPTDNTLNQDVEARTSLYVSKPTDNNLLAFQSKIAPANSNMNYASLTVSPKNKSINNMNTGQFVNKNNPSQASIQASIHQQINNSISSINQLDLLFKRRDILLMSIDQSNGHFTTKMEQVSQQIVLLKKQMQYIQNRIYGHQQYPDYCDNTATMNMGGNQHKYRPHQLYYNSNNRHSKNVNTRNKLNNNSNNKRPMLRSSSKQQHRFRHGGSKIKNNKWNINRVRSSNNILGADVDDGNGNSNNYNGNVKESKTIQNLNRCKSYHTIVTSRQQQSLSRIPHNAHGDNIHTHFQQEHQEQQSQQSQINNKQQETSKDNCQQQYQHHNQYFLPNDSSGPDSNI